MAFLFFKLAHNQRLCEVALCNFAKLMLIKDKIKDKMSSITLFPQRLSNYTTKEKHVIPSQHEQPSKHTNTH